MISNSEQSVNDAAAAPDDAWLESLLRQDASAAAYVDDGGFTASIVNRLPAPAGRSPYRWIVPAMAVLGFLIGLVWLSGGEELYLNLASLAHLRSLSLENVLVVALPLGVLYWLAVGAAWQES